MIKDAHNSLSGKESNKLIRFNHVMRDGIQSLFGTNPSAKEIIGAYQNAHAIGTATIQTLGGTFFDVPARKGRDEWKWSETITKNFREQGVHQTALIRGDCLVSYKPQPFPVIENFVLEYAKMGINTLQNFHGLNDINALSSVAEAGLRARDQGHDIRVQGTICIESNKNVTLDGYRKFAEDLIKTGHDGFYLKSASGKVDPLFIYRITQALIEDFPEQSIDVHVHSTYGVAPICLMTAIEAAVEKGHSIGVDVQHPAMSGSTAHPSMYKIHSLIKKHQNESVRENAPDLNGEAVEADRKALQELRFKYRGYESQYDSDLKRSMQVARAPGGATSTLKTIPGLVPNISGALSKKLGRKANWTDVQIAIYDMQAKILSDLGDPTQVTPYAFNTTLQAAFSLLCELQGKDRWNTIIQQTQEYLAGQFGHIPPTVNPALQYKALQKLNLDKPEDYIPSKDNTELDKDYETAKAKLIEAGVENPTVRQIISACMLKVKDPVQHVINCMEDKNEPQEPPELPEYTRKNLDRPFGNDKRPLICDVLGGAAGLEHFSQQVIFLKQMHDSHQPFPYGSETIRDEWANKLKADVQKFWDSLPSKLVKHGFKEFENKDDKSGLTGNFGKQLRAQTFTKGVLPILKDVLDGRGKGLYEYFVSLTEQPRLNPTPDFTNDIDLRLVAT